jgi:hypothetical protein
VHHEGCRLFVGIPPYYEDRKSQGGLPPFTGPNRPRGGGSVKLAKSPPPLFCPARSCLHAITALQSTSEQQPSVRGDPTHHSLCSSCLNEDHSKGDSCMVDKVL